MTYFQGAALLMYIMQDFFFRKAAEVLLCLHFLCVHCFFFCLFYMRGCAWEWLFEGEGLLKILLSGLLKLLLMCACKCVGFCVCVCCVCIRVYLYVNVYLSVCVCL